MIARSFVYRCYPTKMQREMLSRWQYQCWQVQICAIRQRRMAWQSHRNWGGKLPSWPSQAREITEVRNAEGWDAPSACLLTIAKRVDQAYAKMRKNIKAGLWWSTVKWEKKPSKIGLQFRGDDRGTTLSPHNRRDAMLIIASTIKRLGLVRIRYSRALPPGTSIKQVHVTRRADGWYVSLSCEIPEPCQLPPTGHQVGVDLNVLHVGDSQEVAATSDERVFTQTANLKLSQKRLATLQRLVDYKRKTKGGAKPADQRSKRTAKRRRIIAKRHQKIARQREHVQQYISRRLVDTADLIVFEKLNLNGMRRKGKGSRKRGLNRALATAAPGKLIALTKEKATGAGRTVKQVNPAYTSQICSECGSIGKRKGLNVRAWVCEDCGASHHRDINAARNILKRGMIGDNPEDNSPGEKQTAIHAGIARGGLPCNGADSANLEGLQGPQPELQAGSTKPTERESDLLFRIQSRWIQPGLW